LSPKPKDGLLSVSLEAESETSTDDGVFWSDRPFGELKLHTNMTTLISMPERFGENTADLVLIGMSMWKRFSLKRPSAPFTTVNDGDEKGPFLRTIQLCETSRTAALHPKTSFLLDHPIVLYPRQ
jgi:hypothetical protein